MVSDQVISCGYCKQKYNKDNIKIIEGQVIIKKELYSRYITSALIYNIFICHNPDCQKVNIKVKFFDKEQEINKYWQLLPDSFAKVYSNKIIPNDILNIYKEACSVLHVSYKSTCMLIRKCLEAILKDYWKDKSNNKSLNTLIKEVEKNQRCSAEIIDAFHMVRKCGNFSTHFDKDTNYFIENISLYEVKQLIWLVEFLFEKWYINDHYTKCKLEELNQLKSKLPDKKISNEITK